MVVQLSHSHMPTTANRAARMYNVFFMGLVWIKRVGSGRSALTSIIPRSALLSVVLFAF